MILYMCIRNEYMMGTPPEQLTSSLRFCVNCPALSPRYRGTRTTPSLGQNKGNHVWPSSYDTHWMNIEK
ncbi:hypothetical protein NDU88_004594 [Pleurodeles waltl]|uniref:Uncharacterized protein n=1 Tax=Pleurodeles waltl TaxID=8319 RepID=A0AAV7LIP7_PLEWA|nr:hypothetical protein NDU88_004594 [Pleurodeles waltl]